MPSSEDSTGKIQGQSPAGTEGQPSQSNHADASVTPARSPVDDQHAAAQHQANHDNQEPRWRRRLRYVKDNFPTADFWVALFTGFLVIETFLTIAILSRTDEALHKTADATEQSAQIADRIREITEANDRSWIGPTVARLASIEEGKPLNFSIDYGNSGKQPASINTFTNIGHPSKNDWENNFFEADIFSWTADCIGKTFQENDVVRVAYPGATTYTLNVRSDRLQPPYNITEKMGKGDEIAVLLGCFVYKSFGVDRHSSFCFFYQKDITANNNLGYCPVGQYSD